MGGSVKSTSIKQIALLLPFLCENVVMPLKIQFQARLVAYALGARPSYVGMSGYKECPT